MTIDEIPVKSDKIAITDKLHQLSADEFNALVDMVRLLRNAVVGEGGITYSVSLKNNMGSTVIAVQEGTKATLEFRFVSQAMENLAEGYKPFSEVGLVTVMIKNSKYADYTVVREFETVSNLDIKLDVTEYLTAGSNSIKLQAVGQSTDIQTSPLVYNVQLTSLGVTAPNFQWWNIFTSAFTIPMFISGNDNKILYVEVIGNDYYQKDEVPLGDYVATDSPYPYSVKHPNASGMYTVEFYLTNAEGSLKTQVQSFNVICVVPGDSGKYVAINNVIEKATNWVSNNLFQYTAYDGGDSKAYVKFSVLRNGSEEYQVIEDSVPVGEANTFVYPMEIDTYEEGDFEIQVKLLDEDEGQLNEVFIAVDNRYSYGATAGAVFYMNPRTRTNNQSNYLKVTNVIDGSEIDVTWSGMNWGNDGWTTDKEGNRILRLLSGSSATINYYPFARESATIGKTIEIDFLVDNITDYDSTVLNLATQVERFVGLKVFPEYVVMFSSANKIEDLQSVNICERERIRLTLTLVPMAYGNSGFNLAILYVNGVKNREFLYADNDYFQSNTPITIGSDYADIDIYGIRIYDSGLSTNGVQKNYINWLVDTAQKTQATEENDIYDKDGMYIDFEKTKAKYNVFVFDKEVPSYNNTAKGKGALECYFAEHPDWNFTVENAPIEGQGTSSMFYYRWNLRWKFADDSIMTYADGSETTTGKKLRFTKDPTKPELSKRLCAKKNFASSMHSHKMGSVAAFNDIWQQLGLSNEANARIAVYQYPFVGFQKVLTEEGTYKYNFIGLYTLGPDKGDDLCFGYDTDDYPDLLSIEGADNAPLFALFRVPWNPNQNYMKYNLEEESYMYGTELSWDYGSGAADGGDAVAVKTLYEEQWMPVYNFVYECSDRLKPFVGTAEELNAQKENYYKESCEFWVTGGDVYYYNNIEGKFMPSDPNGIVINLYNQLVDKGYGLLSSDVKDKTVDELNELFRKARIQKFRQEMENYFDLYDAIFHRNWVEFNAATDNRAKNTYPYIFGKTEDGYRWRWRGDDMDTIWSITNQGQSKKGYFVETHDTYDNGQPVWNGETSVFWNLVDAAFEEEIKLEMRKFMAAMETLSGKDTGSNYDRLYAFFDKYYFQQAQEYFPMSLYNADAKFSYEDARLVYGGKNTEDNKGNGKYNNDTDPITQSLGDHYSAEKRWITKRILYMMSKYSYGMFSKDGTDHISVRAAGNVISYDITPAIDMYPAVATGTSLITGPRTKAGETCTMTLTLSGSSDQQNKIQAASYLQDIGQWHDKEVTGDLGISGRMLRTLTIGHESEPITITISTLTISNCTALQTLDVRNISTLSSFIDLSSCTHIKNVYAGGTAVTQIMLPTGGALQNIQYGQYNQYVILRNFPLLTAGGVDVSLCIENIIHFYVQNCPKLDPISLLIDIMDAQENQGNEHNLKYIRAVDFNKTTADKTVLKRISELADGTYKGLNSNGVFTENDPLPVLIGKITLNGNYVQSIVNVLNESFPNLELVLNGIAVLEFNDDEFKRIALTLWDANDDGDITPEEGAVQMIIQDNFKNNANLIEADFSGLNFYIRYNNAQTFVGSTNLKKVIYGEYGGFGAATFSGCSSLETVIFPEDITNYKLSDQGEVVNFSAAFQDCISLKEVVLPKQWNYLNTNINNCFRGCTSLEYLDVPENFNAAFVNGFSYFVAGCSNLKTLILRPTSYTTFYQNCCNGATALESLVIFNPTPTNVQGGGLPTNGTCVIYVPDESVTAYKTASGWLAHADRIKGISEYPGTL